MRRGGPLAAFIVLLFLIPAFAGCFTAPDDVAANGPDPQEAALQRFPGEGLKIENLSGPVHGFAPKQLERIAMSLDGIRIYAEVFTPDGEGPWPTILELSPYNVMRVNGELDELGDGYPYLAYFYVPRGYAVVYAHVRGTGNSEGCMDMMGAKEQQDGHDIVEWIAAQEWSDGKVGMHGVSYVGTTPHAAAIMDPPHLTTIVTIAGVTNQWRNTYQNGVPYQGRPYPITYNAFSAAPPTDVTSGPAWLLNTASALCDQEDALAHMSPGTYEKGVYTPYWAERDMTLSAHRVNASILYSQGFVDRAVNPMEAIDWFNALDVPKKGFFHQGGHILPPRADYRMHEHAWFDHWLQGRDTGIMDTPIVEVQLNDGTIRVGTEWPPVSEPGVIEQTYHLAPGRLETDPPAAGHETYHAAFYRSGPAAILPGDDPARLVYQSEPLDAHLHMAGPAVMHLVGSVDASNTYWLMDLYDVSPSGDVRWIAEGWFNAHLWDGIDKATPLVPGEPYVFEWLFEPREYVFKEGHRIELRIQGHDDRVFPFDAFQSENTVFYGEGATTLTIPVVTEGRVHEAPDGVRG